MATRNRTARFLELRDGFRSHAPYVSLLQILLNECAPFLPLSRPSASGGASKSKIVEMKRLARKGKNAILRKTEDKQGLLQHDSEDLEMGPLEYETPEWIRQVDIVKDNMAKIRQKSIPFVLHSIFQAIAGEELNKHQSKQLRVAFDDDDHSGRQGVDAIAAQMNALFRDSEQRIQTIGAAASGGKNFHKQVSTNNICTIFF